MINPSSQNATLLDLETLLTAYRADPDQQKLLLRVIAKVDKKSNEHFRLWYNNSLVGIDIGPADYYAVIKYLNKKFEKTALATLNFSSFSDPKGGVISFIWNAIQPESPLSSSSLSCEPLSSTSN